MGFPKLNLPSIKLRVRSIPNSQEVEVWDSLRKKFLRLTPEEWVRQHLLHFFVEQYKIAPQLIKCEHPININGQPQRADIILYTTGGEIDILVECKAPDKNLDNSVLLQASRYNDRVKAQRILLTNGISHHLFTLENGEYFSRKLTNLIEL